MCSRVHIKTQPYQSRFELLNTRAFQTCSNSLTLTECTVQRVFFRYGYKCKETRFHMMIEDKGVCAELIIYMYRVYLYIM